MAEVERVQPVEGAQVVAFDYDAADAALGAIRRMSSVVGEQVTPRRTEGGTARSSWTGHFRGEFDEAEHNLLTRFSDTASWGPIGPQGEIYAAVGRANDRQTQYNERRRRELEPEPSDASTPAPTSGPS